MEQAWQVLDEHFEQLLANQLPQLRYPFRIEVDWLNHCAICKGCEGMEAIMGGRIQEEGLGQELFGLRDMDHLCEQHEVWLHTFRLYIVDHRPLRAGVVALVF